MMFGKKRGRRGSSGAAVVIGIGLAVSSRLVLLVAVVVLGLW